jgi:3-hydroxyisobutyrate dehydrogenase-like beta-hydroxyacid dehydrogenase
VRYVGPFGNGSKLKYVANLLVTIHNVSTAEAIVLAQKAGLDLHAMLEVIGAGAGSSRMLEVRGPRMADCEYDDPGMKVDVYQKDLAIIEEFANAVGAPTPLFSQSALIHRAALAQGHAKDDTASVAEVLRTMAGL